MSHETPDVQQGAEELFLAGRHFPAVFLELHIFCSRLRATHSRNIMNMLLHPGLQGFTASMAGEGREHEPHPWDLHAPAWIGIPPRILHADDDSFIRLLVGKLLETAGFAVESVKDGAEAWEVLQKDRFDLLITDNQMPGLCGLELIRNIRAAGMVFPVILVSGAFVAEEEHDFLWEAGGEFLAKPFRAEELIGCVRRKLRAVGFKQDEGGIFPGPGAIFPAREHPCRHWGINE